MLKTSFRHWRARPQPPIRREDYYVFLEARDDLVRLEHLLSSKEVDANADNGNGRHPLHVESLSLATVVLLLKHGADPNATYHAGQGRTPLFWAESADVCRALFRAGADLEHRDHEGTTPLMHAVIFGDLETIAALLALGADANVHDTAGLDLLDHASIHLTERCREKVAAILQSHRAGATREALMALTTTHSPTPRPPRKL